MEVWQWTYFLVPYLKRKTLSLLLLSMMLTVGFFTGALYQVEEFPFISSLLRGFIMNKRWVLSNAFWHLLK